MSVETQHSDDSSTEIENYESFTTDSGVTHYNTENHHVAITEPDETNFLYFNEYVENASHGSVYFTDVTYKRHKDNSLSPSFNFSHDGQTTFSSDQEEVSNGFEELLFEVLIND